MPSHITYKQLLELTSYGIFAMNFKGISVYDERLSKCKKIEKAIYKGLYTGSPGRDIYFMLPYLTDDQMKELVREISKSFPNIPPGNHVNIAMFVRFIYGQFEKEGILRSKKDFKRMEKEKLDWKLSRKFLGFLYKELEKINNYYGLTMLCEMEGHRLGDEAIINKDKDKLKEMERMYNKSVKFACKCESYKQFFTPYYWSAKYFEKFGEEKKSIRYYKLTIEQAEKYCPDARDGYVYKLAEAAKYLKDKDKEGWKVICEMYKNKSEKKCIKRLFNEMNILIKDLKNK